MTDPRPDSPGLDIIPASGATAAGGGHAAAAWTSLREIGGLGLLRLLPGVIRSAVTRGPRESPGGVALPRAADRDGDHLPDLSFDSAITSDSTAQEPMPATASAVDEDVDIADGEAADVAPAEAGSQELLDALDQVLDLDVDRQADGTDAAPAQAVAEAAPVAESGGDVDEAGLS
jgi:hypothetical protein